MRRQIKRIIPSKSVLMGDIPLEQPLPYPDVDQISPFLLLHHLQRDVKPGKQGFHVGAHPHRGFEPVSFIFSGEVRHRDSMGYDSVIGSGGVQWMTAGRGIIHEEGVSPAFAEKGGWYEMIQLWINLPSDLKMTPAVYQGFQADEFDVIEGQAGNMYAQVVSGAVNGVSGRVNSLTGIHSAMIMADGADRLTLSSDPNRTTLLYVLNGTPMINGDLTDEKALVWFGEEGTDVEIETTGNSQMLFLEGDVIDEPVASWGPYVMNTQTEIMEALRDYQMGKMGVLI